MSFTPFWQQCVPFAFSNCHPNLTDYNISRSWSNHSWARSTEESSKPTSMGGTSWFENPSCMAWPRRTTLSSICSCSSRWTSQLGCDIFSFCCLPIPGDIFAYSCIAKRIMWWLVLWKLFCMNTCVFACSQFLHVHWYSLLIPQIWYCDTRKFHWCLVCLISFPHCYIEINKAKNQTVHQNQK